LSVTISASVRELCWRRNFIARSVKADSSPRRTLFMKTGKLIFIRTATGWRNTRFGRRKPELISVIGSTAAAKFVSAIQSDTRKPRGASAVRCFPI